MVQDLTTRWPELDLSARRSRLQHSLALHPGRLTAAIAGVLPSATRAAGGLWTRDASTFSADPGVQAKVAQRLGWLDSPGLMADNIERLRGFAESVRRDGFTDAVLLGMGGSSLAPEVMRAILGTGRDGLRLHMLDSTDPAAVLAVNTPIAHTLYIFASKSGTTIEPNSLAAFFRQMLQQAGVSDWARHFVAITDHGTELAHRARSDRFREVFINPSDIGGRYSALSFFGLVPSALMGQDISALTGWGLSMLSCCQPTALPADQHPAFALGLTMAAGARHKMDKLTLLVPSNLEPFGLWVEQLVAESTGKNGVGVVPIAGETPTTARRYGHDRVFVRLYIAGEPDPQGDALAAELKKLQAPVIDIDMPEAAALGAEFVRWEVATAVAGAVLGINPFDEPNVSQAKDATRVLLGRFKQDGQLPLPTPQLTTPDGTRLTLSAAAVRTLATGRGPEDFLTVLESGDYFGLLAYLGPDPRLGEILQAFRTAVRDKTGVATMSAYGPRYLHSTGQLHKGGPNTGVFVLVSSIPRLDVPIPGEAFSFGTLELAQAIGDFQSLDVTGRRALHVHLSTPEAALLESSLTSLLGRITRQPN